MSKILAIDDKPDNLTTLSGLLNNLMPGCAVINAQSGVEGIEKAGSELPDVILLDIQMPDMDGFETCRQLKSDERTKHIPVIMITAIKTDPQSRIRGLEIGADTFLAKPIDPYELVSQVKVALRIKKAEDGLRAEKDSLERLVEKRTKEIKESKENLEKERELFKAIVDQIPVMLTRYDPHANMLFLNREFERLIGWRTEEVQNIDMMEKVYPDPEYRKKASEHMQKTTAEWKDFHVKSKSGGIIESEWSNIRLEDGTQIGIGIDITERKQAIEELRKSENNYKALAENPNSIVMRFDPKGNIIFVNQYACNLFGYSFKEMMGKKSTDLIHPGIQDDGQSAEDMFAKLLNHPERYQTNENTNLTKDGKRLWISWANTPTYDESGQLTSIICTGFDTTDKKQMETQLQQAQRMESVGRLAGGVAHDYNNALTAIMGFTELAMMDAEPAGPLHDNLNQILKAGRRAQDITRQLLAFARKQTIAPVLLDLNNTVESMIKMLRRLIGEDIDLVWMPAECSWPVKMDPSQIDQILANLCVNARDAIKGVGKITIETNTVAFDAAYCADHAGFIPGEFVLLAVSDNGCGMDKEILDNIFEPFFTTKTIDKGTGLGLSTVYGIVKQNNGFINVYSEPGKGTSVKIYLTRHEGGPVEIQRENTAEIPQGKGETILVVEDDRPILKLTQKTLSSLGYTVLTADTPKGAVNLAREHTDKINLLITDVVMPEMNGLELSKQLKSVCPDLKCIFMSGYTANTIAHHGVLDPGIDFIQKPFSKRDLATIVRKVLDRE